MGSKGLAGCLAAALALMVLPARAAFAQTIQLDVSQVVEQEGLQAGEAVDLQDVCVTYVIERVEEGGAQEEEGAEVPEPEEGDVGASEEDGPLSFTLTGSEERQIGLEAEEAGTWQVRPTEVAGAEGATCLAEGSQEQAAYLVEVHEASDGSLIALVRQKGDEVKRSAMAWTVRVPAPVEAEEELEPEPEPVDEPADEEPSKPAKAPEETEPAEKKQATSAGKPLPKTSDQASPVPYAVLGAAGACVAAGALLRRR